MTLAQAFLIAAPAALVLAAVACFFVRRRFKLPEATLLFALVNPSVTLSGVAVVFWVARQNPLLMLNANAYLKVALLMVLGVCVLSIFLARRNVLAATAVAAAGVALAWLEAPRMLWPALPATEALTLKIVSAVWIAVLALFLVSNRACSSRPRSH